jgi:hypothetical protein
MGKVFTNPYLHLKLSHIMREALYYGLCQDL